MSRSMSAKDMALDFVTTIFSIGLIVFCFYYFIIAGNWQVAGKITKAASTASVFGIFFLLNLKNEKRKIIKFKEEASLDEVLVYFTDYDKVKDLMTVFLLPVIMGGVAFYDSKITSIDWWQMIITFTVAYVWHLFLFRKKEEFGGVMNATVYDRIKDQIFVFFLPIVVISVPLFNRTFNIIDQIQVVSVFGIIYFWHKYLIRKKD